MNYNVKKINSMYNLFMELFIDFKNLENKPALEQAIKIFAATNKNVEFYILVNNEFTTISEDEHIHLVKNFDNLNVTNLYTLSNYEDQESIKLIPLKHLVKGEQSILFGDFNNNNLTLEDKYSLLKDYKLINNETKFALLGTSLGTDSSYEEFIKKHDSDVDFKGIIQTEDILKSGIKILLTTYTISTIFMDSLKYSIHFFGELSNEKEKEEGFFSKMFSFNKTSTVVRPTLNALFENSILYINKNAIIYKDIENMTYDYYFNSLTKFLNIVNKKIIN